MDEFASLYGIDHARLGRESVFEGKRLAKVVAGSIVVLIFGCAASFGFVFGFPVIASVFALVAAFTLYVAMGQERMRVSPKGIVLETQWGTRRFPWSGGRVHPWTKLLVFSAVLDGKTHKAQIENAINQRFPIRLPYERFRAQPGEIRMLVDAMHDRYGDGD